MSRLLAEFYSTPWAIEPAYLRTIEAVLLRWSRGERLTDLELYNAIGNAPAQAQARREAAEQTRGVAVIPVYGPIVQRASMQDLSGPGVTSTSQLSKQIRTVLADRSVDSVILDIDSPGGSVGGVSELAAEIRAARAEKQIIAHANSFAASAAYWLASAAEEIVVTPGGQVGSIGVFAAHEDHSERLSREGISVSLISAGKYKTEGNPYEPLSESAREHMQATVDQYHADFVGAVADGRGVSSETVRDDFGQGRMFLAQEAVDRGMADRIESLDNTIARLRSSDSHRAEFEARDRALKLESLST